MIKNIFIKKQISEIRKNFFSHFLTATNLNSYLKAPLLIQMGTREGRGCHVTQELHLKVCRIEPPS
jgi:hypothetical protein